jgi:hypothetical protein
MASVPGGIGSLGIEIIYIEAGRIVKPGEAA